MGFIDAKYEIRITDSSDRNLFEKIEKDFQIYFSAKSLDVVDGLDQAYHDFDISGTIVTLHLEHYLGVSLFLRHPKPATPKDIEILSRINDYFKTKKVEQGAGVNGYKRSVGYVPTAY